MANSKVEKIKNAEIKITAPVEEAKWQEAQKTAFKKLSKKVQIKGFRKGQAPEAMIRKMISSQEILIEAAQAIAQETLVNSIDENKVELIDRPTLNIQKLDEKECILEFTCPVKPDVKLGDYKSIKYAPKKVTIKKEDIEEELKKIQESKAELELKEDGKVEKNDTAVIDYEGFKDGEPFDGGKAENYDLVIGSGTFIPGFEDQLIGMKAEEEKTIDVTFPEDYHEESLKGKPVQFKVKVHEIKKKVLPEITPELIEELKIENVKTKEELEAHLKETLKNRKEKEEESKATEEVLTKLADDAEIDIPQVMIKFEQEYMYHDYSNQMMSQGIDINTYFKITGGNKDSFMESFKENAIKKVKINLVLEEIAKVEKIEVAKEDIEKEYNDLAKQYSMEVDDIKKYISENQLKEDLLLKKALDFVKQTKDAK